MHKNNLLNLSTFKKRKLKFLVSYNTQKKAIKPLHPKIKTIN